MTEQEAIAYIEACTWSKTRLGLERTKELLRRVGDPQKKLKFIHIAGSNGKGSASAMLASVFEAAGYRTGLYISPYILEFRERIQLNGQYIPMEALCRLTETVKAEADAMEDHPSQFELVTAIGMLYFLEAGADIVMLEVGMGGALDSTNAIDAPECALIMHIGLEHTEYLGSTLEAITKTKCGIFKKGAAAVVYEQEEAVMKTAAACAGEAGVRLVPTLMAPLVFRGANLKGQSFSYNGEDYFLPLLGEHQLHNAAAVLTTVSVMRERGWNLPEEAVKKGLRRVFWPARFEVLSLDPLFILDGGHNPQCAEAMKNALSAYCPGMKFACVMGVLADKNLEEMLSYMAPFIGRLYAVTPDSPRALAAEKLLEAAGSCGVEGTAFDSLAGAVSAASASGMPVLAFGSLYMAGEIRALALGMTKAALRENAPVSVNGAEELSKAVSDALVSVPDTVRCTRLLAYAAMPGEPDVTAAVSAATANFVSVAYPYPEEGRLVPGLPSSMRIFIKEPGKRPAPDPFFTLPVPPGDTDTVLVPVSAYTKEGLALAPDEPYTALVRKCGKAYKIAVAFSCRETDALPAAAAGFAADAVVTENGVFFPA